MYKRRNFLPKPKVLSSWGHKAAWQSQPQKTESSQQVTVLILLDISTQERISSLRHFSCILVERNFKNPTWIFEPNSLETFYRTPFMPHSLVHHIIYQRIRVITLPTTTMLNGEAFAGAQEWWSWMVHSVAHFLSTYYLRGLQRWKRHCIYTLDKSGVQRGKEMHKHMV